MNTFSCEGWLGRINQRSEMFDNLLAQAEHINSELKNISSEQEKNTFLESPDSLNISFSTLLEKTLSDKLFHFESDPDFKILKELKHLSEKKAIFYFILFLYTQSFFEDNPEVELVVYNILTDFLSQTNASKKTDIDAIHNEYISKISPRKLLPYYPPVSEEVGDILNSSSNYLSIISQYTLDILVMMQSSSIELEEDYIDNFSDFLFAESILDWKECINIPEAKTSLEKVYAILYELLLGDFYEDNEKLMYKVASLLITHNGNSETEKYVLNYIAQYTDEIISFTL